MPPTSTAVLRDVLDTNRRKSPTTAIVAHDRLFAGVASSAVEPVAQLVSAPLTVCATSTLSVTSVESPLAIGPGDAQVTMAPAAVHVHPAPVPVAKVSPAGSVSTIVIAPCVAIVPRFATRNR